MPPATVPPETVPPETVPPETVAAPATSSYAFLGFDPTGSPIGWSSCAPIPYQVDFNGAPQTAVQDVATAISDLSAASGYTFTYEGTTSDMPGPVRANEAMAGQVAPLLIAFLNSSSGEERGTGGVEWAGPAGGREKVVYGYAIIDSSVEASPGYGPDAFEGAILLHELGHAMGLAHPPDPNEIMWPTIVDGGPRNYEAGDRAGLAVLHDEPC